MATSSSQSSRGLRERWSSSVPSPYTEDEKQWLKDKFRDEYGFLKYIGLDIRRHEDRDAGRRVLRQIRRGELSLDIFESSSEFSSSSSSTGDEDESNESSSYTESTDETESDRTEVQDFVLTTHNAILCHRLPTGSAYSEDWIWSTRSNVHVANHQSWFKTYIPFDSRTEEGLIVVGAGTVELPVDTNKGVGIITLRNVVHVPAAQCNIVMAMGPGAQYGIDLDYSRQLGRIFLDQDKRGWAFLDCPNKRFFRLRLVGQSSSTRSSLAKDTYVLSATLPNGQIVRLAREVLDEEIHQLYELVREKRKEITTSSSMGHVSE